MRRTALYTLLVFTLLSCGGSEGRFRLKGVFKHLQQGEFYLYSPDGGLNRIDTLKLEGGSFDYNTALTDEATFVLLYPNYSEHVIFARSGDVITVKGDARHLKSTRIEGSEDNEKLTQFRLENQDKSLADQLKAADDLIRENPNSRVSTYLFQTYFLRGAGSTDQPTRARLYKTLCQAQPDNSLLTLWRSEVENRNKITTGKPFPALTLVPTTGDTIRSADYKGQYLLITCWAGWLHKSNSLLHHTRRLRRQSNKKLAAISISLDVSRILYDTQQRIDTVDWPSYCDFRSWNSPCVRELGLRNIPYSILVAPDGKVIAHSENFEKDILPAVKKALNLK